jgi:hypothetical protein
LITSLVQTRTIEAVVPDLSTEFTENAGSLSGRRFISPSSWRNFMVSRSNEAAIDEIVASCDGDLHGALKALLLVNEQLEAELAQLYAVVALGPVERGGRALH